MLAESLRFTEAAAEFHQAGDDPWHRLLAANAERQAPTITTHEFPGNVRLLGVKPAAGQQASDHLLLLLPDGNLSLVDTAGMREISRTHHLQQELLPFRDGKPTGGVQSGCYAVPARDKVLNTWQVLIFSLADQLVFRTLTLDAEPISVRPAASDGSVILLVRIFDGREPGTALWRLLRIPADGTPPVAVQEWRLPVARQMAIADYGESSTLLTVSGGSESPALLRVSSAGDVATVVDDAPVTSCLIADAAPSYGFVATGSRLRSLDARMQATDWPAPSATPIIHLSVARDEWMQPFALAAVTADGVLWEFDTSSALRTITPLGLPVSSAASGSHGAVYVTGGTRLKTVMPSRVAWPDASELKVEGQSLTAHDDNLWVLWLSSRHGQIDLESAPGTGIDDTGSWLPESLRIPASPIRLVFVPGRNELLARFGESVVRLRLNVGDAASIVGDPAELLPGTRGPFTMAGDQWHYWLVLPDGVLRRVPLEPTGTSRDYPMPTKDAPRVVLGGRELSGRLVLWSGGPRSLVALPAGDTCSFAPADGLPLAINADGTTLLRATPADDGSFRVAVRGRDDSCRVAAGSHAEPLVALAGQNADWIVTADGGRLTLQLLDGSRPAEFLQRLPDDITTLRTTGAGRWVAALTATGELHIIDLKPLFDAWSGG